MTVPDPGPDDAVPAWLAAHARPVGVPDDDPEGDDGVTAWVRAVAGGRVVALGPTVAGTRELAQLAGRVLGGLVAQPGVGTLALQTPESATTALDDHVRRGTGSASAVLDLLGSWSWNTREVLDVVRRLAEDPRPVRVAGVDPRHPAAAVRVVGRFLRTAAPDVLPAVADTLADLALGRGDETARVAVDRVQARLDQDAPALMAATSPERYAEAVRHAGFLARAAELVATPRERADAVAGRLMAEAVLEALDAAAPDGRVVLWAHADHVVARDDPPSLGAHLRERLGDGYRALLLTAGTGTTRAIRRRRLFGPARTPSTHRLGAPRADALESVLLPDGTRDHVLDLRVPDVPPAVAAWADATLPRRSVGDEVSTAAPATAVVPCRPGAELDAIAVVRTVHPAWAR
ncbi:erythromycin esterase family protein [Actinomycetospora cinnamomea]|uniref:Erythromycin esterase n=1 Tax=Actinomycetospora cinnamomea TaxID=663609 RepID=A0A2U1EXH9_9PSEU|nr:erythromycin esterase family protein [Actinomycetospora cinnamomea]PVZ04635.1 erythromycin esterase [Actinomycetospora cinnamomea]